MDARSELSTLMDLARITAGLTRQVDRSISSVHGLGVGDLRLLLELADAPGRRMQRVELAERMGVTPSGVARQLGPLERIGVVARESHPSDARLALAVLTDAGAALARDAAVTAQEAAVRAFDTRWSAEQQATLAALLAG